MAHVEELVHRKTDNTALPYISNRNPSSTEPCFVSRATDLLTSINEMNSTHRPTDVSTWDHESTVSRSAAHCVPTNVSPHVARISVGCNTHGTDQRESLFGVLRGLLCSLRGNQRSNRDGSRRFRLLAEVQQLDRLAEMNVRTHLGGMSRVFTDHTDAL